MAASRKEIEYKNSNIPYDPKNKTHQDDIRREIKSFNDAYHALRDYDKRTEALIGLTGCAWLLGYASMTGTLLVCCLYTYFSHAYCGRPEYSNQYQSQLNKLLDLYHWCRKDKDTSITRDPLFCDLTETIAPFVSKKDLLAWENLDGISKTFAEILARPPHQIQFLQSQASSSAWNLFNFAKKIEKTNDAPNKEAKDSNTFSKQFSQSLAELRFALYGRKSHASVASTDHGQSSLPLTPFLKKLI